MLIGMYIRDRLKDIYIKFHFFYNDFYDFNEKIAQDIFFLKDKKYTSKKLSYDLIQFDNANHKIKWLNRLYIKEFQQN